MEGQNGTPRVTQCWMSKDPGEAQTNLQVPVGWDFTSPLCREGQGSMATLHPYPTPSCYLISSESKNKICFQIQLASLFIFKHNDIEKKNHTA